ncbi:MAG: CsgG/HfaB family protein [Holophagales bacterium]|jgi:hypothetical protein|nr:CsgG/HfaB family protein [Holophagales bacterium]
MNVFRKIKVFILCLTALICVALAAQERRPVAVLEPFTKGPVTSLNKNTVRGAINSFLVKTGAYKVVDRARTEQILQEQRFQRSQLGDSSKARSLGKLLGADLICISELIKEEGYFNAELSIIDVEIGEVTNAAYKLIAKDDPIAIDGAIREAMAELLGIKIETPKQEPAHKPVESKPKESGGFVQPLQSVAGFTPIAGKALVIIYWRDQDELLSAYGFRTSFNIHKIRVWINDRSAGKLTTDTIRDRKYATNKNYIQAELPAGNSKIVFDFSEKLRDLQGYNLDIKDGSYPMNFEAGGVYFVRVELAGREQFRSEVKLMSPSDAKREITDRDKIEYKE